MKRNMGGLGERMRAAMEAAGLTQIEVAIQMGKRHQQQISAWLNNSKRPSADNLMQFAEVVGVSMDELAGRPPRHPRPASSQAEAWLTATDALVAGASGAEALRAAGADPQQIKEAELPPGDTLLDVVHELVAQGWQTMTRDEKLDLLGYVARYRARRDLRANGS